jgi:RNA polymerase sigma-70 factor (ECF subfamily)
MEVPPESLSIGVGSPSPRRHPVADRFTPLVRAHTRLVRLAAWQAGVPESDLPDIAQEVFIRLAGAIDDGLDTSAPLDNWLRRTTYRATRDFRKLARNAREKLSLTGDVDQDDRAPNPEEQMQRVDVHRLVNGVLDSLPHEQRIVLVMSEMGEMPMSEIAADLGIHVGTGYSRLRAARKAFEEKLTERQASGQMAVLPFALWNAGDVLSAARVPPAAPPGFEDEVVARVAAKLAAGIASTVAAAGSGAAAAKIGAAGAAKVGVVLTGAQIATVICAAMIVGAVLHAVYVAGTEVRTAPRPAVSAVAGREGVGATVLAPATATATAVAVTSATSASEAKPTGTASPGDDAKRVGSGAPAGDVNERTLLANARGALDRGDVQTALALLARVKSPRFAIEREDLRRLARAMQDGGG